MIGFSHARATSPPSWRPSSSLAAAMATKTFPIRSRCPNAGCRSSPSPRSAAHCRCPRTEALHKAESITVTVAVLPREHAQPAPGSPVHPGRRPRPGGDVPRAASRRNSPACARTATSCSSTRAAAGRSSPLDVRRASPHPTSSPTFSSRIRCRAPPPARGSSPREGSIRRNTRRRPGSTTSTPFARRWATPRSTSGAARTGLASRSNICGNIRIACAAWCWTASSPPSMPLRASMCGRCASPRSMRSSHAAPAPRVPRGASRSGRGARGDSRPPWARRARRRRHRSAHRGKRDAASHVRPRAGGAADAHLRARARSAAPEVIARAMHDDYGPLLAAAQLVTGNLAEQVNIALHYSVDLHRGCTARVGGCAPLAGRCALARPRAARARRLRRLAAWPRAEGCRDAGDERRPRAHPVGRTRPGDPARERRSRSRRRCRTAATSSRAATDTSCRRTPARRASSRRSSTTRRSPRCRPPASTISSGARRPLPWPDRLGPRE